MIDRVFAEKFIERVTRYTDYNVNIMNEKGIIIASRDKERVGLYHEIAYRLIRGTEDTADTTDMSFPNVLPGINMVIASGGRREGVVGVTGRPDEVRPVALMVKMAFETMLKYERQQEEERIRANKKERFIHLLTEVENSDPETLRSYARDLGYPEDAVRIPILLDLEPSMTEGALRMLRSSPLHSRRDFSLELDSHHVLVFKTVPSETEKCFPEYRRQILEYLEDVTSFLARQEKPVSVYVGSFQDSYPRYYYGYSHCRWLEQNVKPSCSEPVFFYDHYGEYQRSVLPVNELQNAFYVYRKHIPEEKLQSFCEIMEALIACNYNFPRAAERMYLHKNTLVYRYNSLKELFQADPLSSGDARVFLESLYAYLTRSLR